MNATPPRIGPRPCGICGRKMAHPIYRRVDHDEYETLCDLCQFAIDHAFTAESAVIYANVVISMHQAVTR